MTPDEERAAVEAARQEAYAATRETLEADLAGVREELRRAVVALAMTRTRWVEEVLPQLTLLQQTLVARLLCVPVDSVEVESQALPARLELTLPVALHEVCGDVELRDAGEEMAIRWR